MNEQPVKNISDVAIVLCGQAGQGIQTVEKLLTGIFSNAGYNVFATKEYMSRVRGGMNSTLIRVSENSVRSAVERIDILLPLDSGAITHLRNRISSHTLVVGEEDICCNEIPKEFHFFNVPFGKIAVNIGNKLYSNVVAAGAILSLLSTDARNAEVYLQAYFAGKPQDIIDKNLEALHRGWELITDDEKKNFIKCKPADRAKSREQILINGAEAVGLGAIAGGCNFVSSYPMSPSTGVLTFMAQHAREFGIIVEQAEDEISAINMAIGAWYGGARAMATTSGGGFALMTEGLSLAGMVESPLVIHLAQRPGPATGLPTRTEQGDLELALYSGHGEFPRIIFAPGTLEDAFVLAGKAFDLADKFQIQVIILTDQFLMDSYYNTPIFEIPQNTYRNYFVKTTKDYRRYEMTQDGISPRGIPGLGDGLVCVDSDEHDAEGHITEDLGLRIRMVDKRLKKYESIKPEIIPPRLIGPEHFENIIICWGATLNAVNEAVAMLGRNDTAILYFSQVYPLHESAGTIIKSASKAIVVEGNATGQFSKILKLYADIDVNQKILKYDGLCFSSDFLAETLRNIL